MHGRNVFSSTLKTLVLGPLSLEQYLQLGGFPRALTFENPKQMLREYFSDIIEKDVKRHVAARSSVVLQNLVKTVYESAGSEVSQRSIAKTLGVSADTVGTYLDACEASYLIQSCSYFSFSEKQRQARNRKFYPIDTGLKNAVVTRSGRDLGKDFETIVFHALRKRHDRVYYWREKGEVDFVIQTDEGLLPIQVSYDKPQPRHIGSVEEFSKKHKNTLPALFITPDNFAELDDLLGY